MSDHSKTEERLRSQEDRSMEQPSTSEPKEQQDSLEPSTSEPDEQQESTEPSTSKATKREAQAEDGRIERLKRYRKEVAHSISIPDTWEKESQLKDWTGSPSALERSLVPEGLSSARQALVVACQQAG